MNVALPNGVVIENVPDDVDRDELRDRAIAAGLATAEDFGLTPTTMADAEAEDSVLDQTGEFVKAVPRGFASGFLSSAEGIAELADATTNYFGLENLIDTGEENELVRLAREGRKAVNQSFLAPDEQYQDAFTTKVGEGLGSLATFLTPGVLALLRCSLPLYCMYL